MAGQVTSIQNALSKGELSPGLLGRTDLKQYTDGTSTCRNFIPNYTGGVMSRAGFAYVGTCKQNGNGPPPRDIPFQFSLNQGYVLEFGDEYLRVKFDGAYITQAAKAVTSVSNAGLFTVASHGYSVGDWVYDSGNTGFSGLTWIILTTPNSNQFTVSDLFGNPVTSATATTGGTVSRIYTQVSPYSVEDLQYLKYSQSADVMTLTCVNTDSGVEYPPYSLSRIANDNWVFSVESFLASISAPTGLTAVAQSSSTVSTWYSYVVTAVDSDTGEESVASLPVNVQNNDISLIQGSNTISWDSVAGASSYNVYKATPSYSVNVPVSSLYGFIGTALGASFTDTNIVADFTVVPPKHSNPFASGVINYVLPVTGGANYSQGTVGYSVTTSTGSDFSGTPVVNESGEITGFVIYDHGHDYAPSDTISFSDTGGGRATGTYTLTSVPGDTNTSYFNGVKVTFLNEPISGPTGTNTINTGIQKTKELTAQALCNTLNASNILSLSVAVYSVTGAVITVKYKYPGSVGNSYTLQADTAPATVSGATLTGGGTVGSGATATLSVGPESGLYPSVSGYFQQRRVYASSLNKPDTYWMSQPGLYNNMDSSIPVTASDAITGTPWAQQVNGIQWLVPMPGGLVVLTGKGAWQINGGQEAAITPSNQTAVPQGYNGANNFVPPITINDDILFVQSKGSIARRLAYSFYTNIYTSTDLTILSDHLFTDFQITQWCWCEEPYKLVWALRNDGQLLSLTFLKDQEVFSWARHDTNGQFVSVCSITEPPVDALYVITRRYVQGAWRYYSERMDDRIWENVEDSFCVDSGLITPAQYPSATLRIGLTSPVGDVDLNTDTNVFAPSDVGKIVRADGGKFIINTYFAPDGVVATILVPPTTLVPNNPQFRPLPVQSGDWSITEEVSSVSGLNHLEGMEVAILADGSVVDNQIVTDGTITLPQPASLITVGLPFLCQVQTMYLNQPAEGGTIQNKRKNISSVGVRVRASRGLEVGADQPDQSAQENFAVLPWTGMNEIKERTNFVYAGAAIPLYTGDYYKNIQSGWDVKGQIAVQQRYPLPANILALISYWSIGDN